MLFLPTLIWLTAVSALSIAVKIGDELFPRGKLIEGETWSFVPAQGTPLPTNGLACVGIVDDLGNFKCQHRYTLTDESWDSYKVFVSETGSVRVNALPGPLGAQVSFPVAISRPAPKAPREIKAGQPLAVPDEKEKSFFAKYWYFFIPLAILFATGGNRSPEGEGEPAPQ